MIEILSKTELTSHEVFNSYPKHFSTPEINLKVPEEVKFKIIDELINNFKFNFLRNF